MNHPRPSHSKHKYPLKKPNKRRQSTQTEEGVESSPQSQQETRLSVCLSGAHSS